jgi:hypothetical protein
MTAPKDHFAPVINSFQFNPNIESIGCPTWEEVSNTLCSNHYIQAKRVSLLQHRPDTIQWAQYLTDVCVTSSQAKKAASSLLRTQTSAGALIIWPTDLRGKDIDLELVILEKLGDHFQLFLVSVYVRQRSIGTGETMVMDDSGCIARVSGFEQGHMAVNTVSRLIEVIEGLRPLTRGRTGLPTVVLIETTNPAKVIDRDVEVSLVAG